MTACLTFRKRLIPGFLRLARRTWWPLPGLVGLLVMAVLLANAGIAPDPLAVLDDDTPTLERSVASADDAIGLDGPLLAMDSPADPAVPPHADRPSPAQKAIVPEPFLVPYGNGPPAAV